MSSFVTIYKTVCVTVYYLKWLSNRSMNVAEESYLRGPTSEEWKPVTNPNCLTRFYAFSWLTYHGCLTMSRISHIKSSNTNSISPHPASNMESTHSLITIRASKIATSKEWVESVIILFKIRVNPWFFCMHDFFLSVLQQIRKFISLNLVKKIFDCFYVNNLLHNIWIHLSYM